MIIKESEFVDRNGIISLPYLRDWDANSDIQVLVQIIIIAFSAKMPVYSKIA